MLLRQGVINNRIRGQGDDYDHSIVADHTFRRLAYRRKHFDVCKSANRSTIGEQGGKYEPHQLPGNYIAHDLRHRICMVCRIFQVSDSLAYLWPNPDRYGGGFIFRATEMARAVCRLVNKTCYAIF